MSLGQNIYRLRTENNMSQSELADKLEVSRQSISKWETDTSVPELDKLLAMSQLFGVSLDELVKGEKPAEAAAEETKEEESLYCLVLTESIFDKETMTRVLCEEFGYDEKNAKTIIAGAPAVIKRGLRYRDADAMERELREIAWTKILHDEDAWNPVKLKEGKSVPPSEATPAGERDEGIGFGGTVLAVVVGVVIAVIILSFC